MKQAILEALPTRPARLTSETAFGKKYEVVLPITEPNGRIVDVRTIWQFDRLPESAQYADAPRLVTLYLAQGEDMTKAKRYDTVVLLESIGMFQQGEKGAVVEVYTTPYEAYDIEMVTDAGKTNGVVEGVRPEQIAVFPQVRFTSIRMEAEGTRATVQFSDGTEVIVSAEELYTQSGR